MRLQRLEPLTLVFRPWLLVVFVSLLSVGNLIGGAIQTYRHGVSMDSTWGPLMGCTLALCIGAAGLRFWTVVFDSGTRTVRWQIRSVRGLKTGEIPYDEVVGVAHPTGKSSSRNPPRGIALVLADRTVFRLSYFTTVHRGFERLQRIGSLIRTEVGIDEPGDALAIADAVLAADSDVMAARAVHDLLGVPLSEARVIARRIRGGEDPGGV
ncbi:MAG: hypothetical protein AAGA55_06545 [Planctomycetota bacterium]